MAIQDEIWENSKSKKGACSDCIHGGEKYNHPGFFNHEADILIVEEAPSRPHFNYSCYDRTGTFADYRYCYEVEHRDDMLQWDLFTDFLQPVWEPFGYEDEEILEEVYMTSSVKCPVTKGKTGYEKKKELDSAFECCSTYLEREIKEISPEVVITAGVSATEGTAEILGVPKSELTRLAISKKEWWGLNSFSTQTSPPMITMPNWFYYTNHHQLSTAEWEMCLSTVREGLEKTVY